MDANDCPYFGATTTINNNNDSQIQSQQQNSIISKDTMRTAKLHKRWNRRIKFLFCCLGYKKNKDSFSDIAQLFADFFAGLEISSSDIVAGFVTLARFQEAQREWNVKNRKDGIYQYLSCLPISPDTKFLDISEADDSHLVNELIYYMNYSLAIFGWPMQMLDDPCMLCCIYPYLRISPCCGKKKRYKKGKAKEKNEPTSATIKTQISEDQQHQEQQATANENQNDHDHTDETSSQATNNPSRLKNANRSSTVRGQLANDCDTPIVLHDNCCGCNAASIERRLAVHNYEIIYVTYHVDVSRVPFLVAADHSKQSIVVAMRGSMSLDDVVTDMNGQIDKLPIKDCPEDWLCHRGISRAANYIKTEIVENHILDRSFNCRPDLGSQDYNLVLCGHSLGAGVAAILGILLRDQYPDLKAYLYSPPGGILSLPVVEHTKEFAIGIILGNDCVPRLGVAQFERLRYQVYLSLRNAPQSPAKILTKTFCPCCSKKTKIEYDPEASMDVLRSSNARTFEYKGIKVPFQVQPQVLYVPGRLLHIVKNYSLQNRATRLFKGPVYQAMWVENTEYDRIMIANGMFFDHLPNNLMRAMKMLFVKTLPVRKNSKTPMHNSFLVSSNNTADSVNNSSLKQPKKVYHSIKINRSNRVHAEKHDVIYDQQKARIDDNHNNDNFVDHGAKALNDNNNNNIEKNDMRAEFDNNGNDENTINRMMAMISQENETKKATTL